MSSDDCHEDGLLLTPLQEHYLKKELINLQLHREFNKLSVTYNDVTGLRKFGPPFAPYDPANPPLNYEESLLISMSYIDHYDMAFPFTRHFFNHFLITFPFISQYQRLGDKNNNEHFWVNKVQKFYEIWKSKKISNSNDRGELSKRKLGLFKLIKFFLMLYNSALPTVTDEIYLTENALKDKNAYKKLNKILPLEQVELSLEDVIHETKYINGIEINVIGVRKNKELKTIRSLNNSIQHLNFWSTPKEEHIDKRYSTFYEFLISVKMQSTGETFYIARRYTEFQKMHHKLFKKFAGKELPRLPSKIKQSSEIDYTDEGPSIDSEDEEYYNDEDDIDSIISGSALSIEKDFANSMKLSSSPVKKSPAYGLNNLFGSKHYSKPSSSSSSTSTHGSSMSVKLPREKLRIALRGYLNALLKIPSVRNSEILLEFLERDKFQVIVAQLEKNDISIRKKLDVNVISQQLLFQQETIKSIKALQVNIESLKEDILSNKSGNGLSPLFLELEEKERIEDLSLPLLSFIDLTKIEIASTLYETFLAKDQSLEFFKVLKKMHQFFPYKIVATIMRFTNPMAIMKKLIDLFLIQPPSFSGNGKSLLQHVFTLVLNDDVKQLTREISVLKENILRKNPQYSVLIKKIENYMENKDDNLVISIKKNSARFNIDLVLSILMNNNDLPIKVSEEILLEVMSSYRNFKHLKKVHADEIDVDHQEKYNFISQKAELFTFLDDLFKAMLRKKDKDNMKELWDEPELTKLIKELITIFFQPLIKIFTEADVYLYIPILKDFIDDLIVLVKSYQNDYSMILSGNSNVVVKFIELLTKYQNYMYTFIRNLYISDKNNDPDSRIFTKLVDWFNSFLMFLKFVENGRPDLKLDLNQIVKALSIDGVIDKNSLLLEVDGIIEQINLKRDMYQKILEKNASPMQVDDKAVDTSKISSNWAEIHRNLSGAINLNSGDLPVNNSEMDELNMEFLELNTKEKIDYLGKLDNREFLNFTTEFEVNRRLGNVKQDIEYNDEEDGFDNLSKEGEIKKLLDPFVKMAYEVLRESQS